jgi:F0F1-type ATP synthase membrane subunit b/b'
MTLNPLEQLNLITMAAMAAIFLVTFFLLRRVVFLPLIGVMEGRERKLERCRLAEQEASALLRKARTEAERILTEAADRSRRLSGAEEEEMIRIREEKCAPASAEAEKILAIGRGEVLRIAEEEQAKLVSHLLTCSRQALVKLIGEVDEDTLRFMVDRVVTTRGAAK